MPPLPSVCRRVMLSGIFFTLIFSILHYGRARCTRHNIHNNCQLAVGGGGTRYGRDGSHPSAARSGVNKSRHWRWLELILLLAWIVNASVPPWAVNQPKGSIEGFKGIVHQKINVSTFVEFFSLNFFKTNAYQPIRKRSLLILDEVCHLADAFLQSDLSARDTGANPSDGWNGSLLIASLWGTMVMVHQDSVRGLNQQTSGYQVRAERWRVQF